MGGKLEKFELHEHGERHSPKGLETAAGMGGEMAEP